VLAACLAKYKANKPGLAAVKAIADEYMGEFDAQEEEVRTVVELPSVLAPRTLTVAVRVPVAGVPPARGAQEPGG
jgi:hypothetical protein